MQFAQSLIRKRKPSVKSLQRSAPWHIIGSNYAERKESMKILRNQIEINAKTRLTLALCTVLALSVASLRAQEDNYGKESKDKGAPGAASTTQAGKAGSLNSSDEQFIKDACKGSHIEVKMGKLGVQKAQNEQVKQFAQKLIDDHTKANTELKQIASSKGITLPEPPDRITATDDSADRTQVREKEDAAHSSDKDHAEFKREWQKLESASGTEFDRQFMSMVVMCHEKGVKEFEKTSQTSTDSEVKAFAAKTLPTLREHLATAKSLQSQVGNVGAPGAETGTQTDRSATPDRTDSDKK
jgi:putative membrane protein